MHDDPLAPIASAQDLAVFPIANRPLAEHQRNAAMAIGQTGPAPHPSPWTLDFHHAAWLVREDLSALVESGKSTLIGKCGTPLAWRGTAADPDDALVASSSFLIVHPWDLLRAHEQHLAGLAFAGIQGSVHPSVVVDGILHTGPGTRILPGVYIEGSVVVGANCKIGPNCHIRGATSIGDHCHIGQSVEIKNSIIRSHSNIGHLSYVGDSIIGSNANLGAGTIVSNFRHDGGNHRSAVNGTLVDTGRRKFGAIIGDGVRTGIHTSIYPGRKLWPGTTTLPGDIVKSDVRASPSIPSSCAAL
jgi:bifunctional UDP-N-acetylglucosamine pyrophosphorylase/glucosamine-1-phosphate N-acetyltransferase